MAIDLSTSSRLTKVFRVRHALSVILLTQRARAVGFRQTKKSGMAIFHVISVTKCSFVNLASLRDVIFSYPVVIAICSAFRGRDDGAFIGIDLDTEDFSPANYFHVVIPVVFRVLRLGTRCFSASVLFSHGNRLGQ